MPIYEMPQLGLLRLTVATTTTAAEWEATGLDTKDEREFTAHLLNYTDSFGSTRDGASLSAEAGSFSMTILDESEDLYEVLYDFAPNEVITPRLRPTNESLGTYTVDDVSSGIEWDDEGNLQKVITISGSDYVAKYSNTNLKEVITGARPMYRAESVTRNGEPVPVGQEADTDDVVTYGLYTVEEYKAHQSSNPIWYLSDWPDATRLTLVYSKPDAIYPGTEAVNGRLDTLREQITDPALKHKQDTNRHPLNVGRILYNL